MDPSQYSQRLNLSAPCNHWLRMRCNRGIYCRFRHDFLGVIPPWASPPQPMVAPPPTSPIWPPWQPAWQPAWVPLFPHVEWCIYGRGCRFLASNQYCSFYHQPDDYVFVNDVLRQGANCDPNVERHTFRAPTTQNRPIPEFH
jgi:hypothetical protein